MMPLAKAAEEFARKAHKDTNHTYDGKPYDEAHLQAVVNVFHRFKYLIPEADQDMVEGGCWTHDTIEDARKTFNDVMKACGPEIAEIAYALTNEKGRNRKERANSKYYRGIRDTRYATFVKFCDRIANIEHGLSAGGHMVDGYRKEHEHFMDELYTPEYDPMVKHMEKLLNKASSEAHGS